jgi:AraC-like DNA-binding protein
MTKPHLLYHAFILMVSICLGATAQNIEQSYLNTLEDESLLTLFDKHNGDSIVQEKIARTYLDRARNQKDTIKMARGYDRLARIFHPEKNIMFADSIIRLTEGIQNITYPAMGYIIKGFELKSSDLSQSTKNYYRAYEIALENKNLAQQLYLMDALIIRKSYWGDSDEALEMQREKHKILYQDNFKELMIKTSRNGYIHEVDNLIIQMKFNSSINYTICFINKREIDSARFYYEKSKELNKQYYGYAKEDQTNILLEILNEIYFYSGLFDECISVSNSILNRKMNSSDYNSLFDAYYFKGMSQLNISSGKNGIVQIIKADSVFDKHKISILPYQRNVFAQLLKYYEEISDYPNQIKYYKKLTLIDSIFKKNLAYYEPSIKNKIQTPAILAEKDVLISELKKESETPDPKLYISLSALTLSLSFLFFYVRKRMVYKKRFEKLLAEQTRKNDPTLQEHASSNHLSNEIVEDILKKLEAFEQQHAYLNATITLQTLAKKFKTNSNYLSRVINLKREKNFSQYLHELRIGYAVEKLLPNASYRKYTIKAIAEECGYNNAESFSRAFYKTHGIYPSYYIKKLEQNNE